MLGLSGYRADDVGSTGWLHATPQRLAPDFQLPKLAAVGGEPGAVVGGEPGLQLLALLPQHGQHVGLEIHVDFAVSRTVVARAVLAVAGYYGYGGSQHHE